jgi:hypothetical protein
VEVKVWEVGPFYSFSIQQDVDSPDRVWHNSNMCEIGNSIPWDDRISGKGGLPHCPACAGM